MYKEYKNKYYFDLLKPTLHLIIRRGDSETIPKICRKLKKEKHQEILNNLVGYYAVTVAAKLVKEIKISQKDFVAINEAIKCQEKDEKLLSDYLDSIEKDVFLEAISEITYWTAIIETNWQISIHKEFLGSWLECHKYLTKKDKNKREGEKIKNKLKIILGDKINYDEVEKQYIGDREWTLNRSDGIFINIDEELDLSRLKNNSNLEIPYECTKDIFGSKFRVLFGSTKCIKVGDKIVSINEYYEENKENINREWLSSKDLIKQILTIYIIKRAQHGDEEAQNILYLLYENKVIWACRHFAKKRNYVHEDDAISRGLTILRSIVGGDKPSDLYKSLDEGQKEKGQRDLLNRTAYRAMKDSYNETFNVIYQQLLVLEDRLDKLKKDTKNYRSRTPKAKKNMTRREYWQKTFSMSQHILVRINSVPIFFEILNPLDMLNISPIYNKDLFKPGKSMNLSTYIFGSKNFPYPGVLDKRLSNVFDGKSQDPRNESFNEEQHFKDESGIYEKKRSSLDLDNM